MAQTLDGVFSTAGQHGQKQLKLPLQAEGDYYATCVRRQLIATPATAMPANAWVPIMGTRTSYTQRLKYSDDLSNAAWTKAATTGTASAATDPEGGSTASKLAEDNTTAAHNVSQAMVVPSGAIAAGVLVKAAERTFVRLRINNATDGNLAIAVFNLSTGVVVSGTGTIKALLNEWFWVSVTGTATIANSAVFVDLSTDGTTFSYLGTTGSGVYLWRATCYLASAIGPAVQTTSATRAVTSPPVDPDDPLAFLVDEMEPDASLLELGVAKWVREYANVPADVVTYGSRVITKPPFPTNDYNSAWVDSTASNVTANVWSAGIATTVSKFATGGTFTITYKTSTTAALNYNDSTATIAAAINALADVITDNFTVSVTGAITTGSLFVQDSGGPGTFNSGDFSLNSTSLTPTCIDGEISGGSGTWQVGIARTALNFNKTGHGLSAAQAIRINTGTTGGGTETTVASVVDADNFTVTNASVNPSVWAYYRTLLRTYSPGTDRVSIRKTQSFYLPGITLGINAASDIPIPDVLLNDANLLAAVTNLATGHQTYDASELGFYKGPIQTQTFEAIDMGDL